MFVIISIHFQLSNVLFYLKQFFLLRFVSLSSKPVFVTKFACANLLANFSAVNLLNSGVLIY